MSDFKGDAIILSGETGTQLKSNILSDYYAFWWGITSGGESSYYRNNTSIVEMNAATGEVYVEDTDKTLLGSAGHAIKFKSSNPHTKNLKIVCVEENDECYRKLKNVINRRWPNIPIAQAEGPIEENTCGVYLCNSEVDEALDILDKIPLGNSIFFFDPLRNYNWNVIEKVAKRRIKSYLQTGTEFIIFLFTSDWFLGRKDFVSLPIVNNRKEWSEKELETVLEADKLFGYQLWRKKILTDMLREDRQDIMVNLYLNKLLKWFRYILPLPFEPKLNQLYHLFFCSNYDLGIKVTKDFYTKRTGNPKYQPDNRKAYNRFKRRHPKLLRGLKGNQRPLEWKILWHVIRYQEGGMCDAYCNELRKKGEGSVKTQIALNWIFEEGYIDEMKGIEPMWEPYHPRYRLNWGFITTELQIEAPSPVIPIRP